MSELNSNLVYLATGINELDEEIKKRLSLKNVVAKEIYYTDFLVSEEMVAGTVVLSRRLEGKVSLSDVIKGLRKKGARVVYCVPKDWEAIDTCLECGVYDLVEDPVFSSTIIKVLDNPMSYKDILDIKSRYDNHMEITGKKIDPSKVLEKAHDDAKKRVEISTPKVETAKIERKSVEQVDVDGLFEGLGNDNLASVDIEVTEEKIVESAEAPEKTSGQSVDETDDIQDEETCVHEAEKEIRNDESTPSKSAMMIGKEEELDEEDEDSSEDLEEESSKGYSISQEENDDKKSFNLKLPSFNVGQIKIKNVFAKTITEKESDHPEELIETQDKPPKKEKPVKDNTFLTSRKNKISKTIGVIGSELDVGTTYVSMLLAFSLGRKKSVLYVVVDELLFKSMTIMESVVTYPFDYTLVNDELYKKYNDYDHIIYDCDQMSNNIGHNLFYTSQRKIIMTSLLPYKISLKASMDAAAYVDIIGVLGLTEDDAILKGVEVRENYKDGKYLSKMQKKLLGDGNE